MTVILLIGCHLPKPSPKTLTKFAGGTPGEISVTAIGLGSIQSTNKVTGSLFIVKSNISVGKSISVALPISFVRATS